MDDVVCGGADTGFEGFTYTTDCVDFYDTHTSAIWNMLREEAESMGYSNPIEMIGTFNRADMLDDEAGFKNLLAWYALEEVSRRETDA